MPPAEDASRAEGWLLENAPDRSTTPQDLVSSFVGRADRLMIGLLQGLTLVLLAWAGGLLALGGFFWLGLAAMAATFVHQQWLIRERDRDRCFQAFLNNHWSGLLVFAGIALSLWPAVNGG